MEAVLSKEGLSVGSFAVPALFRCILKWWVKRKLRSKKILGVVLSPHCGKSTLCANMNSKLNKYKNKKVIFCDLEQTQNTLEISGVLSDETQDNRIINLPEWLATLKDVRKNFKDYKIVVFMSNVETAEYLGISKNCVKCVPSTDLFTEICSKLDEKQKGEAVHNMKEQTKNNALEFESWEELENIVKTLI